MSTAAQIEANRHNAQSSTGPVTEAGKQRSSQNAAKHGFTGQTLVIPQTEYEAYTAHVNAYRAEHKPASHHSENLVQQLADIDWSLHQINVQQTNTISLMNAVHDQDNGSDPIATAKVIAALTRTLNTLSLYEVRRRRAGKAIRQELADLQFARDQQVTQELPQAAELFQIAQESGESFNPQEFGFVCSTEQIQRFIRVRNIAAKAQGALSSTPAKL